MSLIIGLNGGGGGGAAANYKAVIAWDGNSVPVVADIPAGVVVTYQGTNYTGTLVASSATKKYVYLVKAGSGIDTYDEYKTYQNIADGTWFWDKVGSCRIDLTPYRTAAAQDVIDAALAGAIEGKYSKPSTGIPSSDMSSAVQVSLDKADTALQGVPNTYRPATEQDIIDGILSDGLDKTFDEAVSRDSISLPTLCGQPMKLFGAGTPQAGIVPINWKQLADGGYNWNGLPSALGQEYINTSAATNGHYTAVPDGYALKWVNF